MNAICYNPDIKNSIEVLNKLCILLDEYSIEYEVLQINNLKSYYDFVFVIGGDGTILRVSRFYAKYKTPIFGINLGHLGFLSQAGVNNIEKAINFISNKDYKIESRLMLETKGYTALNDFVIKSIDSSRASCFSLEVDGFFVSNYCSDGIIISTPTGSTAYGMSAGGPVLTPDLTALVIVPICPHTFSARPLVVSADSKIVISCDKKYSVCADGQELFLNEGSLSIKKSDYYASLVLLNDNDFYSVLRNKLHWGYSPVVY
ncbi:NAD(+)/NADH kinase [bacterium]|nr:NAD(+)/NADH kinase [bacterium]